MHKSTGLAGVLAGLALALLAHAQSGPDELWDMTVSTEMGGMQMPPVAQQVCMNKGETRAEGFQRDKNCKVTEQRRVGNKLTWKMVCSGPEPMTGTGEITRSGSSMNGRMRLQGKSGGETVDMTMVYAGKLAGSCDAKQQVAAVQAQVAAMQAQGEAQTAQMCRESVQRYATTVFEMQGSPCAAYAGEYCAHVMKTAQSMRTPAGYRKAMQTDGLRGGGWEQAAQYCQVQTAPIATAACKSAAGGREWDFVAEYCPAETQALAAEHCAGREYTAAMSSEYKPVCAKYAGGFAQPQRAAATPAAAPGPTDAVSEGVKEGVRGLRKLFGN